MSELPGSGAVGIESVEWSAEGGGNLTLRVTGRWRRRRPLGAGRPTLVIDAEGRRHRFPAMPDPPSLAGTAPGQWRLSFTIPGWMAPELGGRTWLQFGTVVVPLPVAVPAPGERGALATTAEVPGGEIPPPPSDEPPPEAADDEDPDFADLAVRVSSLERELQDAIVDRDELERARAEGERTRRIAEQRAHAEQALRKDISRRLAENAQEAQRAREALGELAAAEERIRALEAELDLVRRRGDEAEQVAAAAAAAQRRAERQRDPVSAAGVEAARLEFELQLRARRTAAIDRVPAEPQVDAPVVEPELPSPAAPSGADEAPTALVEALRRELELRAAGDAAIRARLIDAEARLAARSLLAQRTANTLTQLRSELDLLRTALERERSLRAAAQHRSEELEQELDAQRARSRGAYEAIGELRSAIDALTAPPTSADPGGSVPAVEPGRLEDARARLRESIAPPDEQIVAPEEMLAPLAPDSPPEPSSASAPEPPPAAVATPARPHPTLERSFRRLVDSDPAAAGELLLALLALQRSVFPHNVAYDLVLGGDRGCVCVTVAGETPVIALQRSPRPREAVDFRVIGEPARIAKLLTSGRLRRRLGLGVARVRGRRGRLAALVALLGAPQHLESLEQAGVAFDPYAAFALTAAMIDPAWTANEQFVLAHRDPAGATTYLVIRAGRPPAVSRQAPEGRVATTIECPAAELLAVLDGRPAAGLTVVGDAGPLASVREWVQRAQCE